MATTAMKCRYCDSECTRHARSSEPRYCCRRCERSFQVTYHYEGNKESTPEKIIQMMMRGSSVRDTRRVLGVSITTGMPPLKNN